jgi:response regulator RpfG family c-di-GMP phosphodiesterase
LERLLLGGKRLRTPGGDDAPSPRTLLLVDDDAGVLTELRLLLRQDGYRILSAKSAAEAFELLALHEVQVVVSDQRMPAMSGTAFLERVKSLYPDTVRILLSGYTDVQTILEAINLGSVNRFYTKPWDDKSLRANIRDSFRQHRLLASSTTH